MGTIENWGGPGGPCRGDSGWDAGGHTGLALQEADTDDHQGKLGFEEFCAFYKMMSTRRDLYLLMLTYSDHKDHLDAADLQRFLEVEQKVRPLAGTRCRGVLHGTTAPHERLVGPGCLGPAFLSVSPDRALGRGLRPSPFAQLSGRRPEASGCQGAMPTPSLDPRRPCPP